MLLTGITAGEGLGFSRAMLFLLDGAATVLQGDISIGGCTLQESVNTWAYLKVLLQNVSEIDALPALLDSVSGSAKSGARPHNPAAGTSLTELLRQISLPALEFGGAVSETLRTGTPHNVAALHPDPLRRVLPPRSDETVEPYSFACMPLRWKGADYGVLVVDNRFLTSERDAISEESIDALRPFAELIALVLETYVLRARN